MTRSGTIFRSWVLAMLWLGLLGASPTTGDGFQVIVHPENPVRVVDTDFLRGAFLKRTTRWKHGPALVPVDLAEQSPVRDRFTREVLEKTPSQLRSYWIQRIFSGTGVPPAVVPPSSPPESVPSVMMATMFVEPLTGTTLFVAMSVIVDPDGAVSGILSQETTVTAIATTQPIQSGARRQRP